MAYSTTADVLAMIDSTDLSQLVDDEDLGGLSDPATDRIERAIEDADAEIDGYLGVKYSVPLSPVPNMIRRISVTIAVYLLFSRRKGPPENWIRLYEEAINYLKSVIAGETSLGNTDPDGTPGGGSQAEFHVDNPERLFRRDKLKGM